MASSSPRLPDLIVRPVRPDEVDRWCACPLEAGDPELADRVAGERAWIEQCHPTLDWLFLACWGGHVVGKYDVPIREARGWVCWAPQARRGPTGARILAALADDLAERAAEAGARRVEVLVDPGYPTPDAAHRALEGAGFAFLERRVLVHRALDATLPLPPPGLDLRDPRTLSADALRRLRLAVDGDEADAEEAVRLVREGHDGVVLFQADRPVGLALAVTPSGESPLGEEHVGLVPAVRGHGLAVGLLLGLLHRGQERGSTVYVGSTRADNVPMRRTFARVGATEVGSRTVYRATPRPAPAAAERA